VLYYELAQTSERVSQTSGRKAKVELLASSLRQASPREAPIVARHLSGQVGHKLGIGHATVAELSPVVPPAAQALSRSRRWISASLPWRR
jgi:DNA ligase-1